MSHGSPILSETHTNGTSATNSTAGQAPDGRRRHHTSNISAFKVRKAVRTLARMCDVPYHRQPLTPQLRHHMVASVAQLVEHRSRKAGVTGSSPVAGSIAQDSRLRAAFFVADFECACANASTTPPATPLLNKKAPPTTIPKGTAINGAQARSSMESRQHTNSSAERLVTPPSKRLQAA